MHLHSTFQAASQLQAEGNFGIGDGRGSFLFVRQCLLLSVIANPHEGDRRREHRLSPAAGSLPDFNFVAHRRVSDPITFRGKRQNRPLMHALVKFDTIHADGNELERRIIKAGRDPGDFVDPFQQVATKKEAIVIHVFWKDEFVVFHSQRLIALCSRGS